MRLAKGKARGQTGPGIYAMSLAICVHARVEIRAGLPLLAPSQLSICVHARVEIQMHAYLCNHPENLQSVYMRELK